MGKNVYGECVCGNELSPVWFTEYETEKIGGYSYKTGRKRRACSHLICENCGKEYCVDDTFDGEWY